jgi:hypothetical protein
MVDVLTEIIINKSVGIVADYVLINKTGLLHLDKFVS